MKLPRSAHLLGMPLIDTHNKVQNVCEFAAGCDEELC